MAEPTPAHLWTYAQLYGAIVTRTGVDSTTAKAHADAGYLKFLQSHRWSFLYPLVTISVTASATPIALPATFETLIEPPTFAAAAGQPPLKKRTSRQIREWLAQSSTSAPPRYFCIEPATFVATTGQRYQIRFYPTPNANYTLTSRARITAGVMTSDSEYHMGNYPLAILYCALSEWEIGATNRPGPYQALADKELARAIATDLDAEGGTIIGHLSEGAREAEGFFLQNEVAES